MAMPLDVKNAYDQLDSIEAQVAAGSTPKKKDFDAVIANVEKVAKETSTPVVDQMDLRKRLEVIKRLSPQPQAKPTVTFSSPRSPTATPKVSHVPKKPSPLRIGSSAESKEQLEAHIHKLAQHVKDAPTQEQARPLYEQLVVADDQYVAAGYGLSPPVDHNVLWLQQLATKPTGRNPPPPPLESVRPPSPPPPAPEEVIVYGQPVPEEQTVEVIVPRDGPPAVEPFEQEAVVERAVFTPFTRTPEPGEGEENSRELELYRETMAQLSEGIALADKGDLTSAQYEAAINKYRFVSSQVNLGRDKRKLLRRRFSEFEQLVQNLANKPLPSAPSASASSSSYAGPPPQSYAPSAPYRPTSFNIGTIGGGLLSTLIYGAVGFGIGFGVGEVLDDTLIDTFQKSRTLFVVTGAFVGMGLGMVIADTLQLSDLIVKYYY